MYLNLLSNNFLKENCLITTINFFEINKYYKYNIQLNDNILIYM